MGNCTNASDVRQANKLQPLSMYVYRYPSTVKYFTWNRDSHGLFDYENKNMIKGQIKTNSATVRMIRQKETLRAVQTKEEMKQFQSAKDIEELIRVSRKLVKYQLETPNKLSNDEDKEGLSDNCPWIVVKTMKSSVSDEQVQLNNNQKGYDLKEGDYIKLGRVRFRIREIKTDGATIRQPDLSKFISTSNLQVMVVAQETVEDQQVSQTDLPSCRVCYNDAETTEDNPLIDCCKCQGSVKYIHVLCLQSWLGQKLQLKTTRFSVSFVWKPFECELCKSIIPNIVKQNGRLYETIVIPKPEVPYIALEILSRDRNQSKGTHIISFAQKQQIKLGRGHDSDVRITDISVSRCHAIIKFNKGFTLQDQKSKFGTLVLMKEGTLMSMEQNNNLALQIGRSVISFHLSREWNVQACCMGPISQDQQQFEEEPNIIGDAIADEDQVDQDLLLDEDQEQQDPAQQSQLPQPVPQQ